MKKILSYILACAMCLSLFVPYVSAENEYTLTVSQPLIIEIEDNIPEGKEAYVLNSPDASGGKFAGSGWGEAGFNEFVIPVTILDEGYYDVEFVESRFAAGSFSRIDAYINDGNNENMVQGFNMNAYPNLDPDFVEKEYKVTNADGAVLGGFGNTMIKQKYTRVWLSAGSVNIIFKIHTIGDHTNFALDYFKFTPVIETVSLDKETTIEFENYVPVGKEAYVVTSADASGGKMVCSEWGETNFTNFTIPVVVKEAGYYDVEFVENRFVAGDGFSRVDGYINDGDNANLLHGFNNNAYPNLDPDFEMKVYEGYTNPMIKQKFDKILLDAGKINICFDILLVGDHTHFALDYFKLSPHIAAGLESLKIGDVEFDENTTYHRSADVITLDYSGKLKTDVIPTVTLKEIGRSDVSFISEFDSSDESKFLIKLCESLKYGKSYELNVTGFIDKRDFALEGKTIEFTTANTDETVATTDSVEIESFTVTNGVANITGVVNSSQNIGIKGRNVKWYMTLPEQEKQLIKESVSQDDGVFDFSFTLTDDNICGTIISEIKSEYAEGKTAEVYYVSDAYMIPILKALKTTTDWQDAKDIIDTNKEVLGINLSADLAGLNAEGFYDQFVGADIQNINEFRNFYSSMLVLEKINQASDVNKVETALSAEGALELFALDVEKITALEENASVLYETILSMDRLKGKAAFVSAFEDAFNKALMSKDGLLDITISIDDLDIKKGEEASLVVTSSQNFQNVKEIILTAIFEGDLETEVSDITFETSLGDCDLTIENNKVTIEIAVEEQDGEEIGTLKFVSSVTGDGTVKIEGVAIAATSTDYDAILAIGEKSSEITVSPQKQQSVGGGGSSGGGGGKYVSKGETVIPQDTEKAETIETNEVFADLDETPWAKDYILGLYNKQAIGKNEEGKFYPARNITRAEFIKIVVLANDIVRGSLVEVNFDDVKQGDWYYQYVEAAVRVGLILGNSDGNFCPNDYITREDICVILGRLAGVNDNITEEQFADDNLISDYAKTAVYTMKQRGIVNGIGDNNFAPKANATRAEAAKIIYGVSK